MIIEGFEFTIGADPELWLMQNGAPVSAHNMIKGNKRRPLKVKDGAVQVDGMALEFNIDPAKDSQEFQDNINSVLAQLKEMIGEDYEFGFNPVANFGYDYMKTQPRVARRLGCEPDYNAYTGDVNPKPKEDTPFRTASGHIHIGWTKVDKEGYPESYDPMDPGHFMACRILATCMDHFLLIPSLVTFDSEEEAQRRSLYGAPGAFRPKPYGMEYRSLSNTWLNHPEWVKWAFDQTARAIHAAFNCGGKLYRTEFPNHYIKADGKVATEIILSESLYQRFVIPPRIHKSNKGVYNPYVKITNSKYDGPASYKINFSPLPDINKLLKAKLEWEEDPLYDFEELGRDQLGN